MKEYEITISGKQTIDDNENDISIYTIGDYDSDGIKSRISYIESSASGFDGDRTTLELNGNDSVSVTRLGEHTTHLLMERGRRNLCHYDLGFTGVSMGVSARDIDNQLTATGGTAHFIYSLDLEASVMSVNDITVTVREKRRKPTRTKTNSEA